MKQEEYKTMQKMCNSDCITYKSQKVRTTKYWPWCDHLGLSTSCLASSLYEWHLKNANIPKQEPGIIRSNMYDNHEAAE